MTDTDFLSAILAEPKADVHRLVYADWLDEQGREEQAEFIRVQCKLAAEYADVQREEPTWIPRMEPAYKRWEASQHLRDRERKLLVSKKVCDWFAVPGLAVSWSMSDGLIGWFGKNSGENAGQTMTTKLHRGFVSEVTCRLYDWIGTVCGRCGGAGKAYGTDRPFEWTGEPKCPVCHGLGRVDAHGPQIVACQPVERVIVTDRRPRLVAGLFWWCDDTYLQELENRLPSELMKLLPNRSPVESEVWRAQTEAAANQALSEALLTWAKVVRKAESVGPDSRQVLTGG